MKPIIIVGAGLAAWTVVKELRKLDQAVPLLMVAADAADFYSKPMLSNAVAADKSIAQLLQTPAANMASTLKVTLKAHTRVSSIDRAGKALILEEGSELTYSHLVLALGADPIRLPIAGDAANEIMSVNDLADYSKFRQRLSMVATGSGHLAILGAGLIGCEFANDLSSSLGKLSVYDLAAQPLGRLLPAQAAAFYQEKLASAGINFHFGRSIRQVDFAQKGSYRLSIDDGSTQHVDLLLSAVGLRPRTSLAEAAGLAINRGIQTDRYLATDDPSIFAIGDCAEVAGLNLPFVLPIMHAARALAATLAGQATTVGYPAMPVVVKTPACPTVVAPPPAGSTGNWQEEVLNDGVRSLFRSAEGQLLGFALCGATAGERQQWAKELPPTLI